MAVRRRHLTRETIGQIVADLKAARTYRRAKRGTNPIRLCAKRHHSVHSSPDNSRKRPAPSRVKRSGDAAHAIDHQDRNAVGSENGKRDSSRRRDHSVAVKAPSRVLGPYRVHCGAVDLVKPRYDTIGRQEVGDRAPVGIDRTRVVADSVCQVKRGKASAAHATNASEESMV